MRGVSSPVVSGILMIYYSTRTGIHLQVEFHVTGQCVQRTADTVIEKGYIQYIDGPPGPYPARAPQFYD